MSTKLRLQMTDSSSKTSKRKIKTMTGWHFRVLYYMQVLFSFGNGHSITFYLYHYSMILLIMILLSNFKFISTFHEPKITEYINYSFNFSTKAQFSSLNPYKKLKNFVECIFI